MLKKYVSIYKMSILTTPLSEGENWKNLKVDENAPSLTYGEKNQAMKVKHFTFPEVARGRILDPKSGQNFVNLSYNLFDQPINGIHGFVRIEGFYSDTMSAYQGASKTIADIDSYNTIVTGNCGTWLPISNKYEEMSKEVIDNNETIKKLRDQDEINAQKKRLEELKERAEREKKVREEAENSVKSDVNTLDYYIERKSIRRSILNEKKKVEKTLQDLNNTLDNIDSIIADKDINYPDYKVKWLNEYNKVSSHIGLPTIESEEAFFS